MSYAKRLVLLCLGVLATPAWATVYVLPDDGTSVVGQDSRIRTQFKDTLPDLARRYSLGYEEIIRANPKVDLWLPGDGTPIVLPGRRILPPGPREGIVVNLPEHRLYYYPKTKKNEKPVVITYPVSIGKMDWRTPLGETKVIAKIKHPSWYPTESVRAEHIQNGDPLPKVVGPGPDNPLGDFAMRLAAGDGTYMIHGTNNPMAVGMAITHGCIRMYPEDVAALFPLIAQGTKVWLVNEPVKVAFVSGELFLEAHPPVDAQGQTTTPQLEQFEKLMNVALGDAQAAIHWDFARQALQNATGIPTVVGLDTEEDPSAAAHPAAVAAAPAGGSPAPQDGKGGSGPASVAPSGSVTPVRAEPGDLAVPGEVATPAQPGDVATPAPRR